MCGSPKSRKQVSIIQSRRGSRDKANGEVEASRQEANRQRILGAGMPLAEQIKVAGRTTLRFPRPLLPLHRDGVGPRRRPAAAAHRKGHFY